MKEFLRINPADNVAVALTPLTAGKVLSTPDGPVTLLEDIPQGHKVALANIGKDAAVIKYGAPIGYAREDIKQGQWIHTHNLKTGLGDVLSYSYEPAITPLTPATPETFLGYQRKNGNVGIRNELWIIPTVGCVGKVATTIAQRANYLISDCVEDVIAFPHPYGCSQMGDDQENTRQILADLANHPNAGGVLVLGLGCENSGVEQIKEHMGDYDQERIRFLVSQECEDEIAASLEILEELAELMAKDQRKPVPCSELIIGMKCGGSDGLSGITANPVVGGFSDLLIARGGSTILTEVPEMFGAETLLMNRCENQELFDQTVDLINDFKNYFTRHDQTIYENPSPGNKKGGISTLEDKSLGCTQKSGSAPVKGVLNYGQTLTTKGLNLLSAPGNDLVASTALAASGAHMVLFTTGRGTPFACPVPTMKISTNSKLYESKKNWIDFNCGTMVDGVPLDELSKDLFNLVLDVASGKKVKSEEAGFHDMAIFKQGVTL